MHRVGEIPTGFESRHKPTYGEGLRQQSAGYSTGWSAHSFGLPGLFAK